MPGITMEATRWCHGTDYLGQRLELLSCSSGEDIGEPILCSFYITVVLT